MTKIDEKHPDFVGKVLCSRGIGAGYTKRPDAAKHKYKKGETIETYRLRNGTKINLPIYYRNKLFTEIDEKHPDFIGKVLCSKGIGAGYTKRPDAAKHKYKKGDPIVTGKQIGRAHV